MLDPLPAEEKVSVVLAGRFERTDFEAEKLVSDGILTAQEGHDARPYRKTISTGSGFRVDSITLFATPSKLNLETNDLSRGDRLRDLVLGILHHATGTPSQACGITYEFCFVLPHDQARDEVIFRQAPAHERWNGVLEHPTVRQLSISGQRWGEFAGQNNVTIRPSRLRDHGLVVAANYHFPMPKGRDKQELSKLAAEFLEREWSAAFSFANRVAKHVFADGDLDVH